MTKSATPKSLINKGNNPTIDADESDETIVSMLILYKNA